MRRFLITCVCATMVVGVFATTEADDDGASSSDSDFIVTGRDYDERGRVAAERGYMRYDHDLGFVRDWTHRPNHQPGGGGGGGGGSDPGTDCESDNFKQTGYRWDEPYSAKASDFASVFSSAGNTWDASTAGSIFGSITSGNDGTAGVQDFKNNLAFVSLGASSTIAVTTTWYFTSSGIAVESDGQYNTFYNWATNGDPDAMDVGAIGTHEIGHTFGLDHPTGNPGQIGCLTMYAYADNGQTHQRTLGDGDILGIKALYG